MYSKNTIYLRATHGTAHARTHIEIRLGLACTLARLQGAPFLGQGEAVVERFNSESAVGKAEPLFGPPDLLLIGMQCIFDTGKNEQFQRFLVLHWGKMGLTNFMLMGGPWHGALKGI